MQICLILYLPILTPTISSTTRINDDKCDDFRALWLLHFNGSFTRINYRTWLPIAWCSFVPTNLTAVSERVRERKWEIYGQMLTSNLSSFVLEIAVGIPVCISCHRAESGPFYLSLLFQRRQDIATKRSRERFIEGDLTRWRSRSRANANCEQRTNCSWQPFRK